jgi:hypothetical protein
MMLTAAEFATLLKSLRSDGRRGGERRNNPRAPVRSKVGFRPIGLLDLVPPKQTVLARDISRTGVGVLLREALKLRTRVIVTLDGASAGTPLELLADVARAQPLQGGQVLLGLRLIGRLTEMQSRRIDMGDATVMLDLLEIPAPAPANAKPERPANGEARAA